MAIHYNFVEPLKNIRDLLDQALASAPDRDAFCYKEHKKDDVHHVSYANFVKDTRALGAALHERGLDTAHIAAVGPNSYPWVTVYLMALQSGGVYVPIDHQLPLLDALHVFDSSESSVLFYSKEHRDLALEAAQKSSRLRLLVALGSQAEDRVESLGAADSISCPSLCLQDLLNEGQDLDPKAFLQHGRSQDELKLLVYTSGTTGVAKGVMLTENNLVNSVYYGLQVSRVLSRSLSVLPWHHTYEAVSGLLVSLHKHCTICINDSLFAILGNLKLYQPDFIYIVPAIAELFYSRILKNVESQGKTRAFQLLIRLSRLLRKIGIDPRRRFFSAIHEAFGGRLERIVCGGAPIRPELGQFFEDIGIQLVGGYGITECSPLVSVNPDELIDYETAGVRLPCLDWKIDQPNEEGIGEILVRGKVVFMGYYQNPEGTAEALRDGWFYTGDYGKITPNDQLIITGRKKNIIILGNGKNIYPEELERYIQDLPFVQEVVCRGVKDERGYEIAIEAEIYCGDQARPKPEEALAAIHHAMHQLPVYKQVNSVRFREEAFPKTSSNKIKRG